jgi:hypothetical protein
MEWSERWFLSGLKGCTKGFCQMLGICYYVHVRCCGWAVKFLLVGGLM